MATSLSSRFNLTSDTLAFGFYAIFMAGFFLIPNAVDQYKFYGLSVFLLGLWLLPRSLNHLQSPVILALVGLYLSWMLTAVLWSSHPLVETLLKYLRLAAYIFVFMTLTVYLASSQPERYEQLLTILVYTAGLAALVSIPLWYSVHPLTERLVGIGTLDNPNTSAFVYGFFAVLATRQGLAAPQGKRRKALIASALVLVVFVVLTQSNTGILATGAGLSLLLLLDRKGRKRNIVVAGLIIIAALLFLASSLGFGDKAMDSGFKKRFPIWQEVSNQIATAPMLGHGFPKTIHLDQNGLPANSNYAHTALMASLRDGGLVAGGLHLAMLLTGIVLASRQYRQTGDSAALAYLGFGFTCMLVDTDQLITRPREAWIILWWPLALIAAAYCRPRLSS